MIGYCSQGQATISMHPVPGHFPATDRQLREQRYFDVSYCIVSIFRSPSCISCPYSNLPFPRIRQASRTDFASTCPTVSAYKYCRELP